MFVLTADARFGPITTIRKRGEPTKYIPWAAFHLSEAHWKRVKLCADILEDANRYHQVCSSTRVPTLHQVIPTIESLASRWEAKLNNPKYAIFHDALRAGLAKLTKYYKKLDNSDVYILALLLHPYYKLDYIERQWGGEEEYLEDLATGEPGAWNWKKHAREVVDRAMERYWPRRLGLLPSPMKDGAAASAPDPMVQKPAHEDDDYDRDWQKRLLSSSSQDGWKHELVKYLEYLDPDVTKDLDTVAWCAVGPHTIIILAVS
ncbi:hypothetical protein LXA43DRAFT_885568 [Ganoderma leucocontextum]|nr:hypothetical protein LXA43DRAFT_885568 [Ganoderma leucocontextum]